jgi:hypothetical protein
MTVGERLHFQHQLRRNGSMRPLEQTLLGTAHNHASIRAALALHSDILDARRMSLGEATAALF